MRVHAADPQDRDGARAVIVEQLRRTPTVSKLFADGGYQGPKLRAAPEGVGRFGPDRDREETKGRQGLHPPLPQMGG